MESVTSSEGLSDVQRFATIEAAQKLISRLQTKEERAYEIGFTWPVVFASLQTCLDVHLWEGWRNAGRDEMTLSELCKLCEPEVDPKLLRRMLRLLAAVNLVDESGEDTYRVTPFTLASGERETFVPQCIDCSTFHYQMSGLNLPKYLAKIGYKVPEDAVKSNYADWSPGHLDAYARCQADPAAQYVFSGFMRGWSGYKKPWVDFFDTTTLLKDADLESAPLCVDIGGHHGVDLIQLLDKHPALPEGSLVLQDLAECVSEVKGLSKQVKVVPHDMFSPQPVKGARAYYFHAVLHNWPDSDALTALRHIADAMKRGYSKLLIDDIVIPRIGASWIQTTMDVEMMSLCSAYERSEHMWTNLLTKAGFRIVKIWKDGRGNESLIEAELA
ncbi:S-adenosyl-L-methionine-dependent methyltransferase [Xylariaceae sp. FL1272]|nr:S-adenosyl-L-methionine-dependent methyltransferase [Xylariaceae sp. FL1272]